jgi:CBS-domain-containing membrane protein
MAEHDIGSLVVMEKRHLAGMLTFREVIRVLAKRQLEHRTGPDSAGGRDRRARCDESQADVATPEMDVNELRRSMIETHQRYLPVMEGHGHGGDLLP